MVYRIIHVIGYMLSRLMAWPPPDYNYFGDYPQHHGFQAADEPPLLFSLCRQPSLPDAEEVGFALRQALRNGLLEWRDRGGHSSLWWAVHHGHLCVVKQLMHGETPSHTPSHTRTATPLPGMHYTAHDRGSLAETGTCCMFPCWWDSRRWGQDLCTKGFTGHHVPQSSTH